MGVLRGETFLHLLDTCPDLHMVGVDLWRPLPESDAPGSRSYAQHDLEGYHEAISRTVKQFGVRAALLRMDTAKAAEAFPDGHFDFVFLDADHTYEGVSRDIEAWLPKIRPGGMMLGHDFNLKDFPGVVRAVDERFPARTLHREAVWGAQL